MNIQAKSNSHVVFTGLTVVVMAVLFAFCYVAQISMAIPLLLLFGGIQLYFNKNASARLLMYMGLLLVSIMAVANYLVIRDVPSFYIPVSSVAMLTLLLFNDVQIAFLMSLIASAIVGLLVGSDFNLILTFFMGSLAGVYSLKGARQRSDLLKAGMWVAVMQIICMTLLTPDWNFVRSMNFVLNYLRPLFFNGILAAIIVLSTSWIFERLFGVLTNFSLIEMADTNHPLLKRMALEAPGTYHHSLIVSNLAEAAADAIGANALLVRVGAYFHDIGKLVKPEYFTENQLTGGNKHDFLEPTMSRLVILNHIKEGIDLARQYKLNPLIIDFIPQHHGTSIIHYFYQRALEGAEEEGEVKEENFRYPGPKPQSRETALVLLGDSVEGATRALDDPNPAKIDEVVRKIINNKFIDGQLNECGLTLKDIEQISKTFSRILSAMHHGRIKYPEKKNGHDDRRHKSAESHPAKPQPNQ